MRLPVASVIALLGPASSRAAICAALDEDSARCAGGHAVLRVARLTASSGQTLAARIDSVAQLPPSVAIVLAERLTDGLSSLDRRAVLDVLHQRATQGCTVVVDDADPVAVLAVAGAALRVDADGRVELEELPDAAALQPLLS